MTTGRAYTSVSRTSSLRIRPLWAEARLCRPPIAEWGIDLSSGRNYLLRAWWISSVPGFCIMLTVVAVNLVGDALRDELDPRLRSLANL